MLPFRHIIIGFTIFACTQAHANSVITPVALELNLLIDVSGSIDTDEFSIQQNGYANAFQSTDVGHAISSLVGGIAVSVSFFSNNSALQIPYTLLEDTTDAINFGIQISNLSGTGFGDTNIAGALATGITGFAQNDFVGTRKVIDISTDGVQNTPLDGSSIEIGDPCLTSGDNFCTPLVVAQRNAAEIAGIEINGLAIESDDPEIAAVAAQFGITGDEAISEYLTLFAITEEGFVISTAFDEEAFTTSITNKLVAEITNMQPVPVPGAIWLLGSSLLGFAGQTKLRRSKTLD